MKTLVISAVNFTEGGPLTVLRDCVASAVAGLHGWRILVLVHDAALIDTPGVEVMAFPQIKSSWLRRVMLEWSGFDRLSRSLDVDLWLSLHDITPRVQARRQAVYCHNPSPFFKMSLRETWLEPKLFLFTLFYRYLYRVNIARNRYVVAQQEWLRAAFEENYPCQSVIVAHPSVRPCAQDIGTPTGRDKFVLLYPALPRVFKNFEVICEAVARLSPDEAARLDVRLTIDGSENRYARALIRRYGHVAGLRFIGLQGREAMQQHYAYSDAVLFPSRLETWGLPISEDKAYGKPLLVADLPYARETVGDYECVAFIDPRDVGEWARAITQLVYGQLSFDGNRARLPAAPFAAGWPALWQLLAKDL